MAQLRGKWKAEWQAKKKLFETETGKKKPSKKFLGLFRKGSGVTSAFAAMDVAFAKISSNASGPERLKTLAAFEKTIAAAKKTGAAYTALLDKELAKEGKDDKNVPLKKAVAPLLDILKSDIDLCISSANSVLEANRALNDANGKADLQKANDMKQFTSRLPANLKAAAMWIKVESQNPDVTSFNEGVQKATRDVTQNLNNIRLKLRKGSPEEKSATKLLAPLMPWANGGKKLDRDKDTFAEVIKELRALQKNIAAIADWNKGMKVEKIIDDLI